MKSLKPLLISITIHLILMGIIIIPVHQTLRLKAVKHTLPRFISMEIQQIGQTLKGLENSTETQSRNVPLAKLGVPNVMGNPKNDTQEIESYYYAIPADITKVAKQYGFYNYLYEKIDGLLTYPSIFKHYEIEGVVTAKLVFTKSGKFLKTQSKVDSSSIYLMGLVRRTLINALNDPLPRTVLKTLKKAGRRFIVHCLFRFELVASGIPIKGFFNKMADGLEFVFYRTFRKGRFEWEWGPLHGKPPKDNENDPIVKMDVIWVVKKFMSLFRSEIPKREVLRRYVDAPEW